MRRSSDSVFFSFLVGTMLEEVASVLVTVPDGTWPLSDSLIFRCEQRDLVQILVDLDSQELVMLHGEREVCVRGDYNDLIECKIDPVALPELALPDKVTSIVEFQGATGKVIGAEIQMTNSAFSVLLYPEDVEVRRSGAIWDFVREFGLRELREVTLLHISTDSSRGSIDPSA
jgi:hypothetical protein